MREGGRQTYSLSNVEVASDCGVQAADFSAPKRIEGRRPKFLLVNNLNIYIPLPVGEGYPIASFRK